MLTHVQLRLNHTRALLLILYSALHFTVLICETHVVVAAGQVTHYFETNDHTFKLIIECVKSQPRKENYSGQINIGLVE